jgi:uncharacterized protein YbjT (DUF2867 family)
MSRILVPGGSGFIGREICRLAVADGHEVRSVSRGGRPDATGSWVDAVEWSEADVFDPNTWRDALDGCDAVIHTVGIISITPEKGATRERLDGDSAIIAALEADRAGVPAFVLLSVEGALAREDHLTAKRRAERTIAELDPRTTVLRLSPVYGEAPESQYPGLVNAALKAIGERDWLARRFGDARPLGVTRVARVALHAAVTPNTPELLDVAAISTDSEMSP